MTFVGLIFANVRICTYLPTTISANVKLLAYIEGGDTMVSQYL